MFMNLLELVRSLPADGKCRTYWNDQRFQDGIASVVLWTWQMLFYEEG